MPQQPRDPHAFAGQLGEVDLHLFNAGQHTKLYEKMGAHPASCGGEVGTIFRVWAPNARKVSLIGSFNHWTRGKHELALTGSSGIWEGFFPGIERGALYKYAITSNLADAVLEKSDPFAIHCEAPPRTASVVWDLHYRWGDDEWMSTRGGRNSLRAPISIYEMHLGSWRRGGDHGERPMTYREMAVPLAEHVRSHGFTHVELLPVMEHPFTGSWGYQVTGYFAPTSRYGTPQDFMFLVDHLHRNGIGVILDWVPAHFPNDAHGLAMFDGSHLYEHADPRQGFHPDWKSCIFNYGRHEVRSFLLSSALFWLDLFHIDGLRVDGVASMLYLDYSRKEGEWIPNKHGGRENLEAIDLLRAMNEAVYAAFPDVQTYAEESTSWPMVSRPVYLGGLGFGMKWDMGWMHDTLSYMQKEPVHRRWHHNQLTFRSLYAFHENFVLPLSHDEVVYGKGSLLGKMPGDEWQQFANLRLLYALMYAQPGKKLLFMGAELAQRSEWNHDGALDWSLCDQPLHRGIGAFLSHLNRTYAGEPALHELDVDASGFEWIEADDAELGVLSFARRSSDDACLIVAAFNTTPVPRYNYRLGVRHEGRWREIVNSDAKEYGGSGQGNLGLVETSPVSCHGRPHSLIVTVPPLGAVFLKREH
ncbi:MAG TPA: 1,4-alpha-glucan branching protein GlgB [Candidatus Limnocylindrales bacterium]|nr:1,4-alpha-glucan branching protein GlgB [Candidatus Limnocylindrales bacterium]